LLRVGRWPALALVGLAIGASVASAQQGRGPAPSGSGHDLAMAAPDPPALRSADQHVLTFRYQAGKVELLRWRKVRLAQPRSTARNTGRYALELLSGRTLAERVRFDFPLLGADELAGTAPGFQGPPRFETKAVVTHEVMVPDSPKFARARLVDRATGAMMPIAWPPEAQATANRITDAGVPDVGHEGGAWDGGRPREAGTDAPIGDAALMDVRMWDALVDAPFPVEDARMRVPDAGRMER
jgi:hypothetical protein